MKTLMKNLGMTIEIKEGVLGLSVPTILRGQKLMRQIAKVLMAVTLVLAPMAVKAVPIGGSPATEYVPGQIGLKALTGGVSGTLPAVGASDGGSIYSYNNKLWYLPSGLANTSAVDLTLAGSASSIAIDTSLTGTYTDGSILLGKGSKLTKDANLVYTATGLGVGTPTPTTKLQVVGGDISVVGGKFSGDGSGLTGITASSLAVNALEAVSINTLGDVIANDAAESMYVGFPYGLAALGPVTRNQTDAMKWNTSLGYGTLTLAGPLTLVSVTRNTALGYKALAGNSGALTNASQNTAVGDRAMQELMVGSSNTAVGSSAMNNLRTGGITQNTAVGTGALFGYNNSSVSYGNVAIGVSTLYSVTNSSSNVAIGTSAMYADTTGSYNTAIGNLALSGNTSGANNIAIGSSVADNITIGNNNIIIGNNIDAQNPTASNQLSVANIIFGTDVGNVTGAAVSSGAIGIGMVPSSGTTDKLTVQGNVKINGTLSATTITGTIGVGQIAAGAVGSTELASNAVAGGTGGVIQDNTITNADISSSAAIDASKINIGNGFRPAMATQSIAQPSLTTTTPITVGAWSLLELTPSAAVDLVTMAVTTQISAGSFTGQQLTIKIVGANSIKFGHGRGLVLSSPTVTLDNNDILVLMWMPASGSSPAAWYEVSRSINS